MWSLVPVALLCMIVNCNEGKQGSGRKRSPIEHRGTERADFRPLRADFRPERTDFRPERTDFRPERANFRSEWPNGETNGRTDVFYRTSSPLGPLPKKHPSLVFWKSDFPQCRTTGTTDTIEH